MIACEPAKNQFSLARKPQDRTPLVGGIYGSRKKTFALGPVHKFDCAVVL
jgi:hypothetical protein